MSIGTARMIIIVALLLTGGLVLANGFGGTETAAAGASDVAADPSPTETATPTETSTNPPKPPEENTVKPAAPKDTVVAVYNGTYEVGLAGTELEKLQAKGYASPDDIEQAATDAQQKPVQQTVVYFVPGPDAEQNRANATALADEFFPGAKVRQVDAALTGEVDRSIQVIVMLGEDTAADAP